VDGHTNGFFQNFIKGLLQGVDSQSLNPFELSQSGPRTEVLQRCSCDFQGNGFSKPDNSRKIFSNSQMEALKDGG
jgi:hypothetical protein